MTWLMDEMRKVLDEIPGMSYAFSQPIDMRVQDMIVGARGDVVVKAFGDDIETLNRVVARYCGADAQDFRCDRRLCAAQFRREISHREDRSLPKPAGLGST